MTRPTFVRARRPEHKQQRREAILDAARRLALESGVRNVTLGGVAADVGLAKSNVVRYFGTREEIYLELLTEAGRDWHDAVVGRLRQTTRPGDVVTVLAETLADRPLFCDLLGQLSQHLEHNVSLTAARAFKETALQLAGGLGQAIAQAHPGLTDDEAVELTHLAAWLAGCLYAASRPSPAVAELYQQEPRLAALCPPFLPTLHRALAALTAGLPTLRDRSA
ncbi:AcrR family transcriptional regulator [Nonomuraea muscovyensis]|uniref:AcrR family transcriptional regulator n=1 Tax=Nonomuraea muscovyensis TaxID=1124761 RepID=A0A7X0EZP6_9ACTN|nr:TetR/AcrR family transcriptional regulator [Nonomuraea muscovyensis]MBB6346941.1 AcrR family transcriptional regulator [Nonomuraea muscovyensis]